MKHKNRWIALALGLAGSSAALAQSSPYYLGATQTFGTNSNVRNVADGQPAERDNFSTTALTAGISQPFGRQRFFLDAGARHTRFNDASDLNNTGYDARIGLDWATIERLSGSLAFGSTQSLARLNPGNAPTASTRNLERTNSVDARFALGGEGRLGLEGNLGHRRVDYSAPEFISREYEQNTAGAGIRYRPGAVLILRTGVQGQDTKYPRYFEVAPDQFEADRAKRRDLYVGAEWAPSPISALITRVSYSRVEYDRATASDFSGLTGTLSWLWRPTGKLQFTTTAARETGQEGAFAIARSSAAATPPTDPSTPGTPTTPASPGTTPSTASASDYSRVTNSLGLRAVYELTAKIRMDAGIGVARRDLSDQSGNSGSDRTTNYSIGALWTPTRVLGFGCSATREVRSSSTVLSSDTHGNTFSCFGQLSLR